MVQILGYLSIRLCTALKQHTGKVGVVEFKMSLVIELEEGRRVGMVFFQMQVMNFRLCCSVPTIFTNVHLGPPLFVVVLVCNSMNL